MKKVIVTSIHFILIAIKVNTQFVNNLQPGYNPGYYQPQQYYDEYDYRRWAPRQGNNLHRRGGGRFPEYPMESNYEYDRPKCKCSCTNCENLKPCCVSVCENCNPQSNVVFVPYPVPLVVSIQSKSPNSTSNTLTSRPVTVTTTLSTTKTGTKKKWTSTTPPRKTLTVQDSAETSSDAPDGSLETQSTPIFDKQRMTKNRLLSFRDDYEVSTFPFYDIKNRPSLAGKKKMCARGRCHLKSYRKVGRINYFGEALNDNEYLRNNNIRRNELPEREYFNIKFPSNSNGAPRYGIVPIPDKLAMKFMQQMRDINMHDNEIR